MRDPRSSRPHMPGYGTLGPEDGSGLLTWSWAVERLTGSRNYWLATVHPDGRPHVMPVRAVWDQDSLWFSSIDMLDPTRNATVRVRPRWAFGLDRADFTGSPTRRVFEEET